MVSGVCSATEELDSAPSSEAGSFDSQDWLVHAVSFIIHRGQKLRLSLHPFSLELDADNTRLNSRSRRLRLPSGRLTPSPAVQPAAFRPSSLRADPH